MAILESAALALVIARLISGTAALGRDVRDINSVRKDLWGETKKKLDDGLDQMDDRFDVRWAQEVLNILGANPQLAVDGLMGPATTSAVKAFQQTRPGLVADGMLGPLTITQMVIALHEKK